MPRTIIPGMVTGAEPVSSYRSPRATPRTARGAALHADPVGSGLLTSQLGAGAGARNASRRPPLRRYVRKKQHRRGGGGMAAAAHRRDVEYARYRRTGGGSALTSQACAASTGGSAPE